MRVNKFKVSSVIAVTLSILIHPWLVVWYTCGILVVGFVGLVCHEFIAKCRLVHHQNPVANGWIALGKWFLIEEESNET